MGKGGQKAEDVTDTKPHFTWEEVRKHTSREDRWIVINGQVYDITNWARKHPGGSKVIGHYAGQDASEAFVAFHNDLDFVNKYMKAIHLGPLDQHQSIEEKDIAVRKDFDELRKTATKLGYFRPSVTFYVTNLLHLIVMEILAYVVMSYWGVSWMTWMISVLLNTTVQAQAGWTQHDFGHLSVFQSTRLNHMLHKYLMNFTKGAASDWWNHLHFQHHAKPNVMDKDPDVRLEHLFVLGENMPKRIAKEKKRSMPYNWQHRYFFAIGPPLLFPLYFQYMIFKHTISRKKWMDLVVTTMFYLKIAFLYTPLLGFMGMMCYYFCVRCLESHWFVWVAQSNHIPMEIAEDKDRPWLPLQLHATCDIEKSAFNDWFTGHLNFQIEHHLFPTMPRHNLYKVAPLVQSLCKKHNIPYVTKTLATGFGDIVRSLKNSGEIWHHYYQAYQLA